MAKRKSNNAELTACPHCGGENGYLQAACDFAGEILKNKRAPGGEHETK